MNKILIEKKYNRQLNIFLGLYIVLCLIFALIFNRFFIKSKAYNKNDSMNVSYTLTATGTESGTATGNITYNTDKNNERGVWVSIDALKEIIENSTTAYMNFNSCSGYVFLKRGGNLKSTYNSNSGYAFNYNLNPGRITSDYRDYMSNLGFIYDNTGNNNDMPIPAIFYSVNLKWGTVTTFKIIDNLQYIDNTEDLKKFFINNDDSVVKVGDPENPPLPEDNSLPVPQSLTCDLKNNDEGAPRFIAGSWKNPASLLASYDASNVNIEIQYKPKIQFYKKLFDLKLGIGTSSNWIPVTKKKLSDIDNWVSYMNLSENNPSSNGKSFHKNGKEDIETIASQNDFTNISSHVELLNGSSWRCRYEINGKTSLWVVYGVDSINQFGRPSNSGDNISFENASGDSISSSEVEYNNSNMTDKNYDSLSFIGKIRYDIDNLFTSLKSFFTPQDENNSFYSFFGRVFEQFPIFWALFVIGLVVAILLRIFGR